VREREREREREKERERERQTVSNDPFISFGTLYEVRVRVRFSVRFEVRFRVRFRNKVRVGGLKLDSKLRVKTIPKDIKFWVTNITMTTSI
jgi:hypothetical protein